MATYLQWARKFRETKSVPRVQFVYGAERSLVESLVAEVRSATDVPELTLFGGERPDAEIWFSVKQFGIGSKNRFIVVRGAECIEDWSGLQSIMATGSTVKMLFVSEEVNVDTAEPHFALMRKRGRVVKCSSLSDEDFITAMLMNFNVSQDGARVLRDAYQGDLSMAFEAAAKLSYFGAQITPSLATALKPRSEPSDFVHSLLAMDKRRALHAAKHVTEEDIPKVLRDLEYRLYAAQRLFRGLRDGNSLYQSASRYKIPSFVSKELADVVQFYDATHATSCFKALAVVDAAVSAGNTNGVLETLVVLW